MRVAVGEPDMILIQATLTAITADVDVAPVSGIGKIQFRTVAAPEAIWMLFLPRQTLPNFPPNRHE